MDIDVIAENLTELLTNTVNMTSVFYDIFLNPVPMDVTFQQYNDNNELITVTIPNRAKDRQIALTGAGSPEGVVSAPIGTAYVDTLNEDIYFKMSGDDASGWVQFITFQDLNEAVEEIESEIAGKANDDEVVHLEGTETIVGDKIFTGNTTVEGSILIENGITFQNGSDTTNFYTIGFDSSGNALIKTEEEEKGLYIEKGQSGIPYKVIDKSDIATPFSTGVVQPDGSTIIVNSEGVISAGSLRNIGEVVKSPIPLSDASLHPLDGALLPGEGFFADFVNEISSYPPDSSFFAQPVTGGTTEQTFVQSVLTHNGTLGGSTFACSDNGHHTTSSSMDTYFIFTPLQNVDKGLDLTAPKGSRYLYFYNPNPLKVSKLKIYNRYSTGSGTGAITKFELAGSNNGSSWTTIGTYTNSITGANTNWTTTINSDTFYKYHRINVITSTYVDSGSTVIRHMDITATEQVSVVSKTAEEVWQEEYAAKGVCDKFVYDSVNNTVRLPKYGNQLYTSSFASTVPVVGNGMTLGLTDGSNNYGLDTVNYYGHFSSTNYGTAVGNSDGPNVVTNKSLGITIDGTKSGVVADTSNIANGMSVYYYIVVANAGNKTAAQTDIDEIATDLNGKMDVDGTNAAASVKHFDGGWVDSLLTIGSAVTAPVNDDLEYDLSSYLPNDNYNYEVLFGAAVTTGTSSGDITRIRIKSSMITSPVYVSDIQTRASSSVMQGGSTLLPIGTSRTVTVAAYSANTGKFNFYAYGYRRIGLNQ